MSPSEPAGLAVPAGYFDGRSARRYPVFVSIDRGIASVEGEEVKRAEPLSAVRIDGTLGTAPRTLRFADGAFCEVTDVDALQRLLAAEGIQPPVVSQWETSWRWVVASVVVFLAVVFLTYRFGIPMVSRVVAYRVPPVASAAIGREVLGFLDRQLLAPTGLPHERQDALTAHFGRLRIPASPPGLPYRLEFRRSQLLGPNAMALPSGTIVITDELVALARDDREIMGVLAHEAGHVDRRHGLRQMIQSSIVGFLIAWYVGDVSTIAAAAPTALIEAKYSRDLEREADAYAAAILRDNRIDVRHLTTMLRRLDQKATAYPDALRYLSTHPATAERLADLERSR